MANGTPGPSQTPLPLPGWLGPIVQITTQVGVPTVFAGILLWFVLMKVGGALDTIEASETERTKILLAMQDTLIAALDRQTEKFEQAINHNIEANKSMMDQYTRSLERGIGGH